MTERSGGHTPLSRMRFSWQRKDEPEAAPPGDSSEPEAHAVPRTDDAPADGHTAGYPGQPGAPPGYDDPPVGASVPSTGWVQTPPTGAPPTETPPPAGRWSAPRPDFSTPPVPDGDAPRDKAPPMAPAGDAQAKKDGKQKSGVSARRREQPAPDRTEGGFDVPPPGGRFSGKRGTHAGVRSAIVITCCLVVLGTVGFGAYVYGAAAAGDRDYVLSEGDAAAYHLSEFPLEQAGQFAENYVRICLNHPEAEAAKEQRQDQLAQYASEGVDATCGWNGSGVQSVIDVAWTGESTPMTEAGYGENARWLTVRALTTSGSRVVEVPVYVEDLASGQGLRIVGDLGEMPQPVLANVERPAANTDVDVELGEALVDGEFFQQFFTAWGASENAALQRLVSPDATPAARSGLSGTLVQPQIDDAQIFYPDGTDPDEFSWDVGASAEAWVWVVWQNPRVDEETTSTRAYRVQLVKTADASNPTQEWAVRDIRGGVPDVDD